jgi:curved DNA-binding protein CbpA
MTGQDHYRVLGVARDADLSQIRAAYVSLLKRYHPDQADAREALENAPQIQRVITAYRVLKDSAARAQYDATFRPAVRPTFTPNSPPPFARKIHRAGFRFKLDREAIAYTVMLVFAAVGLHLLVSRLIQEPRPARKALPGSSSMQEIAARTQLEAVVRNAGMMSRAEASNYSSRCFAAAQGGRDPVATDMCIGFDMAYVYWRDAVGGPLITDPYFQAEAMDSRFRNALNRLKPTGTAARVQSIRAATLRAIMQTPRPTDDFGFSLSERQAITHSAGAQKANEGALSRH